MKFEKLTEYFDALYNKDQLGFIDIWQTLKVSDLLQMMNLWGKYFSTWVLDYNLEVASDLIDLKNLIDNSSKKRLKLEI